MPAKLFMIYFAWLDRVPISLCHILKALFVSSLERMIKYWKHHSNWEAIEELLVETCNLSYGRWWYWAELHTALNSKRSRFSRGVGVRYSNEATNILAAAASIAKRRGEESEYQITIADLLYSIGQSGTSLSRGLVTTGMDMRKIKRAVKKQQRGHDTKR